MLSELIDNAIASRLNDRVLQVTVDLFVDANGLPIEFLIKDNASGIPKEKLGLAITPAGIHSHNSLNEHGLGMKQAVSALGKLKFLATKTKDEEKARVILKFEFGNLETYFANFDSESGTEILIGELKPIVVSHPTTMTRTIVPYLGARYRRFLRPDNKVLNLVLNIKRIKSLETLYTWTTEEIKPIYFHPSTRTNRPVILNHPLTGLGWRAELTFGYAPKDDSEYQELGIGAPSKFHPYFVSINRQGLDLILHDRVILFHQLSELGIINTRHNDYNSIRGEITLIEGFATAITKNSIISDNHFRECIEAAKQILHGDAEGPGGQSKDYLNLTTYPEELPESLLRDRLATWLETNPIQPRSNVHKEYVLEGIEGYIDVFADGEAWELKIEQASALDVYQLFMYLDVGKIKKGYLVAKTFTTGADVARKHIVETHGKEIVFSTLSKFPVNHPPSEAERDEYY